MPSKLRQVFPPSPGFTERDLGDLTGKVFIVTGSTSGVGFELASLLFGANATVYLAARSASKLEDAQRRIARATPASTGLLVPLSMDLSDLRTIRPAVQQFLARETRLDVLFSNAGIMMPPVGSLTAQGHDLEMGTNCLGPHLLANLLTPILECTVAISPPGSVRIVWVASMISQGVIPGGIEFDIYGNPKVLKNQGNSYMATKVGTYFQAVDAAEKLAPRGIMSISLHPGIMKTELQRHNSLMPTWMISTMFKGPRFGAYTELFAGLSPDVTQEHTGHFIIPWGRFGDVPPHIMEGLKSKEQGGNGKASQFIQWCDKEVAPFW